MKSNKEITTIRFYLQNAAEFIKFMTLIHPPNCRLNRNETVEILSVLEKEREHTGRPITLHRHKVKREKMKKLPSSMAIQKCLRVAPGKIEELLGKLLLSLVYNSDYLVNVSHPNHCLLSYRRA